jgi:hypothetical protein
MMKSNLNFVAKMDTCYYFNKSKKSSSSLATALKSGALPDPFTETANAAN